MASIFQQKTREYMGFKKIRLEGLGVVANAILAT
jgi:hypothetical protein